MLDHEMIEKVKQLEENGKISSQEATDLLNTIFSKSNIDESLQSKQVDLEVLKNGETIDVVESFIAYDTVTNDGKRVVYEVDDDVSEFVWTAQKVGSQNFTIKSEHKIDLNFCVHNKNKIQIKCTGDINDLSLKVLLQDNKVQFKFIDSKEFIERLNANIEVTIYLPKTINSLVVKEIYSSILVEDFKTLTNIELASQYGDVRVCDVNSVNKCVLSSVMGSIFGEDIHTNIALFTNVNGSVEAYDIHGRIIVNNVSGGVEISDVRGEMEIDTVSGQIDISDLVNNCKISSVSGGVGISDVSAKNVGQLDVSTISGKVTIDDLCNIPEVGEYNFKTQSGSIDININNKKMLVLDGEDKKIIVKNLSKTFTLVASSFSGKINIKQERER